MRGRWAGWDTLLRPLHMDGVGLVLALVCRYGIRCGDNQTGTLEVRDPCTWYGVSCPDNRVRCGVCCTTRRHAVPVLLTPLTEARHRGHVCGWLLLCCVPCQTATLGELNRTRIRDPDSGHVLEINLPENNLTGRLPANISSFVKLR